MGVSRNMATPLFSGKCNVLHLKSSNPRETIQSHIEALAEDMKQNLKDMKYPLLLSIKSGEVGQAREAFRTGRPFPCRIIVCFFTALKCFLMPILEWPSSCGCHKKSFFPESPFILQPRLWGSTGNSWFFKKVIIQWWWSRPSPGFYICCFWQIKKSIFRVISFLSYLILLN